MKHTHTHTHTHKEGAPERNKTTTPPPPPIRTFLSASARWAYLRMSSLRCSISSGTDSSGT